jgi:hypothetical protein
MATAQEFDALDGLKITGSLEVGANVAVDTNVLFVDTVNNRVGIGVSNPSNTLEIAGNTLITGSSTFTVAGGLASLDGGIDVDGQFTVANGTGNIVSGGKLTVNGNTVINSDYTFIGASSLDFLAVNATLISSLVPSSVYGGGTNIDLGATGGAEWRNLYIKSTAFIDTLQVDTAANINANINITDNIVHTGDTDTLIAFDTNNIKLYAGNATTEKINITTTQVNITDSLVVGSVIQARKITAEDYFIETKVAATSGTGTKTYDLSAGASFEHTATGAFTANFTNVPGTNTTSWTIKVVNNGTAHAITWQVGGADVVNWSEGTQPPESTGTDIYSFISIAGTVYGSLAIRNAS